MAAAGLPLLKLSTLLVKTIAKPLGGYMKSKARQWPRLDTTMCWVGNSYHYANVRLNVLASGHRFISCKPLPHDVALKDGVSIFSEGLVLGFSAFVIITETARSTAKANAKAQREEAQKVAHEKEQDRERRDLLKRLTRLEQVVGRRALEREKEREERRVKGRSWWW
jgi:hypothetical protein